jgi:hypothetical protein
MACECAKCGVFGPPESVEAVDDQLSSLFECCHDSSADHQVSFEGIVSVENGDGGFTIGLDVSAYSVTGVTEGCGIVGIIAAR